jgi:Phage integrase family/Recombinase zinc beta ribbon domain
VAGQHRRGDPHRQDPLGPLHDLGHAPQPRLRRPGLLRQDRPPQPASRPQPGRPAGRARDRHRLHDRGPPPRRLARDRRPGPGRRGDLRAGSTPPGQQQKFASRASKTPSLLQGLAACSGCGYACYRGHTTTTAGNKIFYYRCIGSDNYRFEHGKVCGNKPVRADYLDQLVWDHITHLIADPALIRAEIDKRLAQNRTADPATAQRKRLDDALAKTTSAITRLIGAYQEDLLSLDELRARMPDLRARETSLRHQAQALDDQLADREVYLKLAENLESFLATLRKSAATATAEDRQRVVRLLVKEILVGPGKIVIRHSIPTRGDTPAPAPLSTDSDDDAEPVPSSHLRWRSHDPTLRGAGVGLFLLSVGRHDPGFEERLDQRAHPLVLDPPPQAAHQRRMIDFIEAGPDVGFQHPLVVPGCRGPVVDLGDRVVRAAARAEPVRARLEVRLEDGLEHQLESGLDRPVGHGGDPELAEHGAGRIVRRIARRAGITKPVGPHTLRHAFITAAADAGVPLRDVQEAASPADPRTTMRYDRARTSLGRHATYIVAAYVAGAAR